MDLHCDRVSILPSSLVITHMLWVFTISLRVAPSATNVIGDRLQDTFLEKKTAVHLS